MVTAMTDDDATADLRRQLKRVDAVLRSGHGPLDYARKRRAEITQQLAALRNANEKE